MLTIGVACARAGTALRLDQCSSAEKGIRQHIALLGKDMTKGKMQIQADPVSIPLILGNLFCDL